MPEHNSRPVVRLDRQTYEQYEKQVTKATAIVPVEPIAAGFALGVQHALKMLRDGFVVGV